MTRADAILLARRCLHELCDLAGMPPARSFALEASFEALLWRVSEDETPDDWTAYLARIHYAKEHGEAN